MKKLLFILVSLVAMGGNIVADQTNWSSYLFAKKPATLSELRREFLEQALHFGYVCHNFINESQTTVTKRALAEQIKSTYTNAIAKARTITANADRQAHAEFAQYLLTICNTYGIRTKLYQSFPAQVSPMASFADNVTLIKQAIAAIESHMNGTSLRQVPSRIKNALFYNYITTHAIPNALSYVVAPLPLGRYLYNLDKRPTEWFKMIVGPSQDYWTDRDEFQNQYRDEQRKKRRADIAAGRMSPNDPYEYVYDNDDYETKFDAFRKNKHKNELQEFSKKRAKFITEKVQPEKLVAALIFAPLAYKAGRYLQKLQIEEYMGRQNKVQRNEAVEEAMKKVVIKQDSGVSFAQLSRTENITKIQSSVTHLNNPAVSGTQGLLLAGFDESTLASLPRAISHATKTPVINLSFLQASSLVTVQAVVKRAEEYAAKQPNKAIIIHIDGLDLIEHNSKAFKNITQLIFNAQRNPYLSILVIGTAVNKDTVPAQLMPYFALPK